MGDILAILGHLFVLALYLIGTGVIVFLFLTAMLAFWPAAVIFLIACAIMWVSVNE